MGKEIQIFIKGLEGKTKILRIDQDAEVAELRKKAAELANVPEKEMRLVTGCKEIRSKNEFGETNFLSDFKIVNESNLYVVLRLKGGKLPGAEESKDEKTQGQQPSPKFYGNVPRTSKPCMIMMDDDLKDLRAEMPCGHAISADGLVGFLRSLLSAGRYEIRCPSVEGGYCGARWDYFKIKTMMYLPPTEIKEFDIKMAENYLTKVIGIQECPKCSSYCERERKKDKRVICPVCSRNQGKTYEFCWCCLRDWNTANTQNCGNHGCTGRDPRFEFLDNCAKKTVVEVPNCPAVRACPKCGTLIEHIEKCKQMDCPCGQKFCFICLKMADSSGKYQCGSYDTKCDVAPIQTEFPGSD